MKKQRIDESDGERQLPEPLIQHILSYLSIGHAARMSLLSKSWYKAWSTYPVLNLDHDDEAYNTVRGPRKNPHYPVSPDEIRQEFMNYANKSLERYRNQNACIQELCLSMRCWACLDSSRYVRKLFDNIEKSGIVKGLNLSFSLCGRISALPDLFRVLQSEALIGLDVTGGCRLRQESGYEEIKCCLLKRLSLKNVRMDNATLECLISKCPLIETLKLVCYNGLDRIKIANLHRLKELWVTDNIFIGSENNKGSEIEVEAPSLESFYCLHAGRVSKFKLHPCQKLTRLSLAALPIQDGFFENLADNFPKLEDLRVDDCGGYEKINISSNSLKSLSLKSYQEARDPEINAPGLVSFTYEGDKFPCFISSDIPSTKSECCLQIIKSVELPIDASWFFQLKKTLRSFDHSTISLSITIHSLNAVENLSYSPIYRAVPEVEVEILTLNIWQLSSSSSESSTFSSIVDNLFLSCRPKTICVERSTYYNEKLMKFLCYTLMDDGNQEECESGEGKLWKNDLKGAEIQAFNNEDGIEEQLAPIDWRDLVNPSHFTFGSALSKVFFRLEWLK